MVKWKPAIAEIAGNARETIWQCFSGFQPIRNQSIGKRDTIEWHRDPTRDSSFIFLIEIFEQQDL